MWILKVQKWQLWGPSKLPTTLLQGWVAGLARGQRMSSHAHAIGCKEVVMLLYNWLCSLEITIRPPLLQCPCSIELTLDSVALPLPGLLLPNPTLWGQREDFPILSSLCTMASDFSLHIHALPSKILFHCPCSDNIPFPLCLGFSLAMKKESGLVFGW